MKAVFEDKDTFNLSEECISETQFERGRSLEEAINNLDKTFMELVFSFADRKGLTDVEVQKKANLDRKAFSKLKCGTTRNPSKTTALAIANALELNLDDTKDLLSRARLALSPCSKQDVIVQYFIEKEAYDIYEINVALFEHGEQLLGTHNT
ncbi:MAG: helix-turn-helix transcriptional regulator [Lachnospiraceae bacterium]|nr:helix-turn-helix transcriptional regulator [Lachnospiraceae bacterium]